MRELNWPHVVATALCLAMLGGLALAITSYEPHAFTAQEAAASQARSLANCGSGMFDVTPHDQQCPRFDAISLQRTPCFRPDCEAFVLELHADGRARLDVVLPAKQAGRYEARVSPAEFHQLANLVASLKLDRRGSVATQTDVGGDRLRAGCGGQWTVDATRGGAAGEVEGVAACLLDVKQRADWNDVAPAADAVPVTP